MNLLVNFDLLVLCVIGVVVAIVSLYAVVHVIRQRSDAFTAVGKLSKNAWLGIVVGSALFLLLIPIFKTVSNFSFPGFILAFQGLRSEFTLLWLVGLVATLVYMVDVRPAVVGVQRGER